MKTTKKKKKRFVLEAKFGDETGARVKRLIESMPEGSRTTSAMLKRAFHLLERGMELQASGGAVVFREADGSEKKAVIT